MEQQKLCPICHRTHKVILKEDGDIYICDSNRCYYITDYLPQSVSEIEKERYYNAIYNFIEATPFNNKFGHNYYWRFFYEETDTQPVTENSINVYHLMKQYPIQVIDRIDKILLNLAEKYPLLSDIFSENDLINNPRYVYCESSNPNQEVSGIFSALKNCGYIEKARAPGGNFFSNQYNISIDGWKRIAELRKATTAKKQGFIAMSFNKNNAELLPIENAFKLAIRTAGYEPQIIKDKEHNNYIMPEIFHEIELSKFVVVDVTEQNYGAYYEAGYAQALGKEVIVCCKEAVFNSDKKPHFDIAQKSMIIWKDIDDLVDRLKKRIEATVK